MLSESKTKIILIRVIISWQRLCFVPKFVTDFVHVSGHICSVQWTFQVALVVKNLPANAGDIRDTGLIPESGRSPGGGAWQLTPVFLPGQSHGQRSLVGYGPKYRSVRYNWSNLVCTHGNLTFHLSKAARLFSKAAAPFYISARSTLEL